MHLVVRGPACPCSAIASGGRPRNFHLPDRRGGIVAAEPRSGSLGGERNENASAGVSRIAHFAILSTSSSIQSAVPYRIETMVSAQMSNSRRSLSGVKKQFTAGSRFSNRRLVPFAMFSQRAPVEKADGRPTWDTRLRRSTSRGTKRRMAANFAKLPGMLRGLGRQPWSATALAQRCC